MAINKIKTGSIQDGTVTADDIQDGAITNAKVNACAAIVQSKVSGLATSISNLCSSISSVSSSIGQQANNIGLLGFKMAVNDGLTVFNLVDGVVDEFNDESGTEEAEGSNDTYCGTSDFYTNTCGVSATITSETFASTTVATSARIVVFEENVDTPTLNTDIIVSVSRDAGVTFTAATLSDSGYVTGSSGQRILTGQADISGQPSGQSMRWKLALANNQVKIHGVSLQWS